MVASSSTHYGAILIGVFTGITALAAVAYFVVTARIHHHNRVIAGSHRPVLMAEVKDLSFNKAGVSVTPRLDRNLATRTEDQCRLVDVHVINRSGVIQNVVIGSESRFLFHWKGWRRQVVVLPQDFSMGAGPTGFVRPFVVINDERVWPESDDQGWSRRRYFLILRGITDTSEPVRFFGRIRLRRFTRHQVLM